MSFVTTQPETLDRRGRQFAGHRLCDGGREYGRSGSDHRGGSRSCRRGVGADGGAVRRARPDVQAISAQAAAIHEMFVNTLGDQRRLVCGHRGRQCGRGALGSRRFSHGFRGVTARDQLRADVCRSGVGVDAGRCDGLERAGRPIAFRGGLVRVGDLGADRRAVAGPVVGGDGGRGRTLCGVDERDRRAG